MGRRTLTPRQSDIANLVRDSHTNREIAQALNLGVSTVKLELVFIYIKLDVEDRIALAVHWDREHPRWRSRSRA